MPIRKSLKIMLFSLLCLVFFFAGEMRRDCRMPVLIAGVPAENCSFPDSVTDVHAESDSVMKPVTPVAGMRTADSVSASGMSVSGEAALAYSGGRDSLPLSDSVGSADKALEFPAFSVARDSMIEDFSNGRKVIYYYGDIKVDYGNMSIKADYMRYDVDEGVVYASGLPDASGVVQGKPEMNDNGTTYKMDEVYYNFKTRKARIKNVITTQQDGILHGSKIKMMPDKSMNIKNGRYTTCDCEHPHFYLNMTTAKVVTEPKQMTVFGPAYAVLEDVPTPLVLPFGFVPKMATRSSGILIPTYGEELARGFFLQGLGYYFVIGEHWDIAATGDIYTMGSWAVRLDSRYRKRYKHNGGFNISYSHDQVGEKDSPDFMSTNNFKIRWDHSQDPKARPGTSFRASVNFSSPSYNKYDGNSTIDDRLESQASSSISYSKTWTGTPFSLSVNMLHSQNMRDSSYSFTLPNVTFTMNRIYPFKRKEMVGKEKLYEKIAFSYKATIDNKIAFKAAEFGQPDFWDKMQNGVKHDFSINLPSFSLFKYIQVAPTVSYGMNWYFRDIEKKYNYETQQVETVQSDAFSTFGVSQNFSAGLSLNTILYGMFNFGKWSKVQAIRHMVTPSLSFSYRPDMRFPANGTRTLTYLDQNGIMREQMYNRFEGSLYAPSTSGQSATMSFNIGNNLEAKVMDRQDTTGTGTKKIKLIDQLSLSGSYNFLADSMKLSNINVTLSTNLFQNLSINGNLNLDPYAINERGQRIAQFNCVYGNWYELVRLTNASLSMRYRFQGTGSSGSGGSSGQNSGSGSTYERIYTDPVTGEYIPGGWTYYMPPDVPWSVDLEYIYSYSRSYNYANDVLKTVHNHTQTLGVTGQIRLTPALNVNLRTGLDLTRLELTTTELSATYDLHCFQISFSWVPMGQWQRWSFRINAKASALADLLQFRKNASFWDNRY